MSNAICRYPDCGKSVHGHGLCSGHWIQRGKGHALKPLRPMRRPSDDPVAWFLSWFDTSGGPDACHEWQRNRDRRGYGRSKAMAVTGRTERTHVMAWILAHGPIPEGMLVCHACDNPPCGNIAHLFLGTSADNSADMVAKSRQWRPDGERNSLAKLTADNVREIRSRAADGESRASIARHFGVDPSNVSLIVTGKAWPHVL